MDAYFYLIHQHHPRTMEQIAGIAGVVYAKNEAEAEDKAWAQSGGDTAALQFVARVPEEGYSCFIPQYRIGGGTT